MEIRCGQIIIESLAGRLCKLRQISTVLEFHHEFQRLSNRVRGLSEEFFISIYLSGSKDEIRLGVHKLNPISLPDAFSLARLQGEEVIVRQRSFRVDEGRFKSVANSYTIKSSIGVIKRLTPVETRDRRERALCYHCDEKLTPNNECKTQKLFWVKGVMSAEEGEEQLYPECHSNADNSENSSPQISLHANNGMFTPQTMQIVGTL